MLADQLANADRVDEAIEQLQLAHAQLMRQGRIPDADVVAARLRALDPEAELSAVRQDRMASADGLVVLDVGAVNLPRPTGVFDGGVILASEPAEEDQLVLPPPERGLLGQPAAAGPEIGLEALTPIDAPAAGAEDVSPEGVAPATPVTDLPLIEPDAPARLTLLDLAELEVSQRAPQDAIRPEGPARRVTSVALAPTVDGLAAQVGMAPEDWLLRRLYGEALLDVGRRDEGIAELEHALDLCERAGDAASVASLTEELVRVAPDTVRFHQRRVESAAASGDSQRLTGAFLD
ncbi:MAG: hypothetical protein ACKOC2_01035, partial [Gemmatimonadota bacterium]